MKVCQTFHLLKYKYRESLKSSCANDHSCLCNDNLKYAKCMNYIFLLNNKSVCYKYEFFLKRKEKSMFPHTSENFSLQTFENFEFLKVLGKGTFGKVIMCREKATNQVPIY